MNQRTLTIRRELIVVVRWYQKSIWQDYWPQRVHSNSLLMICLREYLALLIEGMLYPLPLNTCLIFWMIRHYYTIFRTKKLYTHGNPIGMLTLKYIFWTCWPLKISGYMAIYSLIMQLLKNSSVNVFCTCWPSLKEALIFFLTDDVVLQFL